MRESILLIVVDCFHQRKMSRATREGVIGVVTIIFCSFYLFHLLIAPFYVLVLYRLLSQRKLREVFIMTTKQQDDAGGGGSIASNSSSSGDVKKREVWSSRTAFYFAAVGAGDYYYC